MQSTLLERGLISSEDLSLVKILDDPDASDNDKYVALELIKNAVISSEREFPMCQDTGTAIVIAKKGQSVWTGFNDEEAFSKVEAFLETMDHYREIRREEGLL